MRRSRSSIVSSPHRPLMAAAMLLLLGLCVIPFIANAQENTASSSSTGWVVIPVEEYQQLRSRAFPGERPPEPPPVDATLTRADYDLKVNNAGDLATGRASLTIDVIKDGWVRVAIPSGLLVREARLDGNLVSLAPGVAGKAGHPSLETSLAFAPLGVTGSQWRPPPAASRGRRSKPTLDACASSTSLAAGCLWGLCRGRSRSWRWRR